VRQAAGDLNLDGKLGYGMRIIPEADGVRIGSDYLPRASVTKPAPAPDHRRGLIGEYGWDHDTLYILEKEGKLTALIEGYDYYPLEEISPDVFRFPNWGLYDGETLAFHRGVNGRDTEDVLNHAVVFNRCKIFGEEQDILHNQL